MIASNIDHPREKEKGEAQLATWARILLFILAYAFIGGIFLLIGGLLIGIPSEDFGIINNLSIDKITKLQFFNLLGVVLSIFFFRKFVDRRTFLSIGLSIKNRFADFITGFVITIAIFSLGFFTLYFFNYIKITEINFNTNTLLLSFFLFLFISLFEELMMRGYILNNLLESMNKYLALIISSAIFSLFHIFNDNTSLLGMINLFLAGLTLGAAYIYTRNLWFPISMHLFWNFIQGPILGFNVSGLNLDSLLVLDISGRTIITGGDFGFEGSILCTILELISLIGILYYFRKKNTSQPEKVMATL